MSSSLSPVSPGQNPTVDLREIGLSSNTITLFACAIITAAGVALTVASPIHAPIIWVGVTLVNITIIALKILSEICFSDEGDTDTQQGILGAIGDLVSDIVDDSTTTDIVDDSNNNLSNIALVNHDIPDFVWNPNTPVNDISEGQAGHRLKVDSKVSLEHFARMNHLEDNIPEPPQDVKIGMLVNLFDKINYTEPTYEGGLLREDFVDPDHIKVEEFSGGSKITNKAEIKKLLQKFVSRINNRESFSGVNKEDEVFYGKVEKYIKWVIYSYRKIDEDTNMVPKKPDQIDDSMHELREKQIKLKNQFQQAMHRLAEANLHCGGRVMTESIECYELATEGAASDALERILQNRLHSARRAIINEIARETHPRSGIFHAHVVHKYVLHLGRSRGILGGTTQYNDGYSQHVDKDKAYRLFDTKYNRDFIVRYVRGGINGTPSDSGGTYREYDMADIQDWFRKNIPNEWKNKAVNTEVYEDVYDQMNHEFIWTPEYKIRDEALEYLLKTTGYITE